MFNLLGYCYRFQFWKLTIQNFIQKEGMDSVVVLSYTTLLSLVPLLAVVISLFSISDIFQTIQAQLLNDLFANLLPEAAQQIESHLLNFSLQAAQLPIISIGFMLVMVVLLMAKVDDKINQMWDKRLQRTWWVSLMHYLGVSLLGPFLLALSFLLSSSLSALPLLQDWLHIPFLNFPILALLPILLGLFGFALLYRFVPIRTVRWSAAWLGAILVSIALAGLKFGFHFYVAWVPTYNLIYGTFAIVPLFLLWVYLAWLIVLLGASVVRQLSQSDPLRA